MSKEYTRRTCAACGARDIQPNMVQKEIRVRTGRSDTGLSFGVVAGSLLGNQKSQKKFGQRVFANNRRNYTRIKKVWVCEECVDDVKSDVSSELGFVAKFVIWSIVIIIGLSILLNS
jgi:hypothetical protein